MPPMLIILVLTVYLAGWTLVNHSHLHLLHIDQILTLTHPFYLFILILLCFIALFSCLHRYNRAVPQIVDHLIRQIGARQ